MTQPFLSIVTISFNQVKYLRQCVDSVLKQKGEDVEYIVIDPGSTDGSREIIESYGAAIDHVVLEPDEGPADGLNRGFALARGQIGYFINSDDLMMPNAVNGLRRLWSCHPDADVLLGNAWMIDAEGRPTRELHAARQTRLQDFLTDRATLVQQGMSFRMTAFGEIGGFNAANRTCWDYELLCRILARGGRAIRVLDRFGAFRMSGENISSGVGGKVHIRQLREDKARIFTELVGRPPSVGLTRAAFQRSTKALANTPLLLGRLSDRLAPSRIARRWTADVTPRRDR